MIRNYIVTALRNIRKNILASLITVVGFSIGISCALFVFLYVQYECSFDTFLPGHERTYRILLSASTFLGAPFLSSNINMEVKNTLLSHNCGIENITQFIVSDALLGYDNRYFYEQANFFATDASFLKVFRYPLVQGDEDSALETPGSLVLTREKARKLFGDENPIGKVVSYQNSFLGGNPIYFTVTGVLQDLPQNSRLQFDFVANSPFSQIEDQVIAFYNKAYGADARKEYLNFPAQTYVSLTGNALLPAFSKALKEATQKILTPEMRMSFNYAKLIPEKLDGMYLSSPVDSPFEKRGNIAFVLLLAGLGIIVIVIACINVVNLATARSLTRSKEIGIRKTLGASRKQLMAQYIVESLVLAFISLWVAMIIVEVFLPMFGAMVKRDLQIHYLQNPLYLVAVVGFTAVIGILGGLYPAVYLSSFNPVTVLRGQKTPSSRKFREVMVVVQFVFSIGLFITAAIILREFQFVRNVDLGFDAQNVVMVRTIMPEVERKLPDIKKAIQAVPGVLGVSASSFAGWDNGQLVQDMPLSTVYGSQYTDIMVVDPDYLRIHKIPLLKGKDFDPQYDNPRYQQLIINETARKRFGFELNSLVTESNLIGSVVGIAKDFDYLFPSGRMRPLIMTTHSPFLINTAYAPSPLHFQYLLVRIQPGAEQRVLAAVEEVWKNLNPGYSFDYKFEQAEVTRQLDAYSQSFETVLGVSTILTFLLSGLGLFGLASFEIERRTKEVGIRKALGATSAQIVLHFLKGFLWLIGIANLIAWPLTFSLVRGIFALIQYPHPLVIGPAVFFEAGIISVGVMVLTVGSQTLRAAAANPVNTLRYE